MKQADTGYMTHDRAESVNWIKSLRLRLYGHTGRTNNERIPKQIMTKKNEGTQKIGRSQERWTKEVEED